MPRVFDLHPICIVFAKKIISLFVEFPGVFCKLIQSLIHFRLVFDFNFLNRFG